MDNSYQWWEVVGIFAAVGVLLVIAYVEHWRETRGMTPDEKRRSEEDFRDDPENW